MHLTVEVAGVTFKNPILPAASELVFNGESARRIAESGVGGIVTKTFTSSPEFRVRLRPYQFPLARFDAAFKKSGSFYSLASPHPKIDTKRCTLCQTCSECCSYQVLHFDKRKKIIAVDKDRCWSCGFCVGICPEAAIILVDRATEKKRIWDGIRYSCTLFNFERKLRRKVI
ncbi:MAG: 4Fe-4S dicluster domain-containing protein [Thermodesulfobacteriota bacterium]